MKQIHNTQAAADWGILGPEQLMLSTTSLENANSQLPDGEFLAYAYTPSGETHQYRRLGACDAEGFPLGEAPAELETEQDTAPQEETGSINLERTLPEQTEAAAE